MKMGMKMYKWGMMLWLRGENCIMYNLWTHITNIIYMIYLTSLYIHIYPYWKIIPANLFVPAIVLLLVWTNPYQLHVQYGVAEKRRQSLYIEDLIFHGLKVPIAIFFILGIYNVGLLTTGAMIATNMPHNYTIVDMRVYNCLIYIKTTFTWDIVYNPA